MTTEDSQATTPDRYLPIGDYALLSDCHSTALVSSGGSIDWGCLRRMDHNAAFCRILDHDAGGYFAIRPVADLVEKSRRYIEQTMVLETTLTTSSGTIVLTDAFAMKEGGASAPRAQLLRRASCTAGKVDVEIIIEARFDFGEVIPWLRTGDDGKVTLIGSDDALAIDADVSFEVDLDEGRLTATRTLTAGESLRVTAVAQAAHLIDPSAANAGDVDERFDETITWWTDWSRSTVADGKYAATVERSALVLKALNCAPTGAIIAAPTTSLPEIEGGGANWDYRYCWVRDATLALGALSRVGHDEMAQGFRDFIMRLSAGHGAELQIMYGCYGARKLPEAELDLEGWRGSRPVRVGNAAATQVQLDVYGHLLDAVHLWQRHTSQDGGGENVSVDADEWRFLASVVERAIENWQRPDSGIWELRGEPRHYVQSKLMVWVAIDCGIRLVEDYGVDDVDLEHWRTTRDEVRASIETDGLDPTGTHFVQYYGGDTVDASLLKLPLMRFIDANDERMLATVAEIEKQLSHGPDGFIRRFRDEPGDDDGPGRANDDEGVFLLCTFWLVEVLTMQGRTDDARALFERALGTGNDLGLFAEEWNVERSEMLGNFPQAFTHLGLIAAETRLQSITNA